MGDSKTCLVCADLAVDGVCFEDSTFEAGWSMWGSVFVQGSTTARLATPVGSVG